MRAKGNRRGLRDDVKEKEKKEKEKKEREGEVKSLGREANMGDEVRERLF